MLAMMSVRILNDLTSTFEGWDDVVVDILLTYLLIEAGVLDHTHYLRTHT